MAIAIIPCIAHGRLYFQTADVLFPTFAQAATAWAATEAHRLDVAEPIRVEEREQELHQHTAITGRGGAS